MGVGQWVFGGQAQVVDCGLVLRQGREVDGTFKRAVGKDFNTLAGL